MQSNMRPEVLKHLKCLHTRAGQSGAHFLSYASSFTNFHSISPSTPVSFKRKGAFSTNCPEPILSTVCWNWASSISSNSPHLEPLFVAMDASGKRVCVAPGRLGARRGRKGGQLSKGLATRRAD